MNLLRTYVSVVVTKLSVSIFVVVVFFLTFKIPACLTGWSSQLVQQDLASTVLVECSTEIRMF